MTSIHEKIEMIRKPRVHIKYEVETENGTVEKELPFVVGVMGDFSGNYFSQEKKSLKDRKFTVIDRDNFNHVMQNLMVGLSINVKDTISGNDAEMAVNLQFNKIDDFEPTQIVEHVPALKNLMEIRNKLRDLMTKADRSETLALILEKTLHDQTALHNLASALDLIENKYKS